MCKWTEVDYEAGKVAFLLQAMYFNVYMHPQLDYTCENDHTDGLSHRRLTSPQCPAVPAFSLGPSAECFHAARCDAQVACPRRSASTDRVPVHGIPTTAAAVNFVLCMVRATARSSEHRSSEDWVAAGEDTEVEKGDGERERESRVRSRTDLKKDKQVSTSTRRYHQRKTREGEEGYKEWKIEQRGGKKTNSRRTQRAGPTVPAKYDDKCAASTHPPRAGMCAWNQKTQDEYTDFIDETRKREIREKKESSTKAKGKN
ncbi:hypothetical protein B0H11DRAFT_1932176 [Mycena galericulata]|nr:hypothetical protein B0H11DRAFT_1932176 [Mycena galericulata]